MDPTANIAPRQESDGYERPLGCGWFDSSFDLKCGLAVCIHDNPDQITNDLAVDVWISWHLASSALSQPAAACASSELQMSK